MIRIDSFSDFDFVFVSILLFIFVFIVLVQVHFVIHFLFWNIWNFQVMLVLVLCALILDLDDIYKGLFVCIYFSFV